MCASEKTALDTPWMNWCAMERAKRSGRMRQSLAGRLGMADLDWIGSSHYLYSVSRSASRSLFMLLELETAGRHVIGGMVISACHAWKECEHIHNCQTAPHGARHAHARVYARTYSNTPHHTDTD